MPPDHTVPLTAARRKKLTSLAGGEWPFNHAIAAALGEIRRLEAREAGVCRICREPISTPYTVDYGREHAHSACLEKARKP
jgi:hypothetical protein